MRIPKLVAAIAAASMVSTPVLAQANQAEVARSASPMSEENNLRGGFVIPLIAIIAIILGILAATHDNDDDLPHSP